MLFRYLHDDAFLAFSREHKHLYAACLLDLYERFPRDPASVDEGWRAYLSSLTPADVQRLESAAAPSGPAAAGPDLEKVFAALR